MIFVTGTTRGLGLAFFNLLANKKKRFVAISRKFSLSQRVKEGVIFITLDLSNIRAVSNWKWEFPSPWEERIIFINNAGTMGKIATLEKLQAADIVNAVNVNLVAPLILSSTLAKHCKKLNIINISTGAADKTIANWGLYCSTKAGAKSFFSVCALQKNVMVYHVDPGVMDTDMQSYIRNSDFPAVNSFVGYNNRGELKNSADVAEAIYR